MPKSHLKNLFTNNNLNNWNGINWPPNNGAKNLIKVEKGNELTNKVFDRFQTGNNSHVLGGRYASPVLNSSEGVEDLVFTYDSRALADEIQNGTYYYKFRLKGNLSQDIEFKYGEAIPWFGLSGNADQVKSSFAFNQIPSENIEIINKLVYENGNWVPVN